jgi:hypothetical protein
MPGGTDSPVTWKSKPCEWFAFGAFRMTRIEADSIRVMLTTQSIIPVFSEDNNRMFACGWRFFDDTKCRFDGSALLPVSLSTQTATLVGQAYERQKKKPMVPKL